VRRLIILLTTCVAACSASTQARQREQADLPAPDTTPVLTGHAAVDLTGTWKTGSTGEPDAKQIVVTPQCNYSPAVWIIEQAGDSLQAWRIPESHAQGIASTVPISRVGAAGRVAGVDVVIGGAGARYVLRYDSTSTHLRGTLNGAPFWAARMEVVHPQGCIPPP